MNLGFQIKNLKKGQSLIELLVALGVFVLAATTITFLIIDAYIADRAGRERTRATFLAEEGLEAVRSIRDNNWSDLINGNHGLIISGNNWIFQGAEEDVSDQLREGKRKIIVEEVDSDRKKITSQVTWKLTEARSQNVSLITYLTNWAQTVEAASCKEACQWEGYQCKKKKDCECEAAEKCKGLDLGEVGECTAGKICCCKK